MNITNHQLAESINNLLTNSQCGFIDSMEEFQAFMTDLTKTVATHCGGTVNSPAAMSNEAIGGFSYGIDLSNAAWAICDEEDDELSIDIFDGYLKINHNMFRVSFQVPARSSGAERDQAFVSALSSVAEINYLNVGNSANEAMPFSTYVSLDLSSTYGYEHPTHTRAAWEQQAPGIAYWEWVAAFIEQSAGNARPRNIFIEAFCANQINPADTTCPKKNHGFTKNKMLLAHQVLCAVNANGVTSILAEEDGGSLMVSQCLSILNPDGAIDYWRGRSVSEFLESHGIETPPIKTFPIQYAVSEAENEDQRTSHRISVSEMHNAMPVEPNGWRFLNGLTVFMEQPEAEEASANQA